MRELLFASCILILFTSSAAAQDWSELQALPVNTPVRVHQLGGRGGEVSGLLQSVDDIQLTLLRGDRPVVVPRSAISRVDQRLKDPIWEGLLFGAIYAAVMTAAFKDDSWTAFQTTANFVGSMALGAFIDYRIQRTRTVYRAPGANVTLLRVHF